MITAMPRIAIAVNDFARTIRTFREAFGMPVVDASDRTVSSLGARIAMCVPEGGSNIEIMSPEDPDAPLCRSLQGFLDRRGEGLFALMLEAPDPDAEAEELLARDLAVLPLMEGAGGRDVHPKSTHGVLIRVYPNDSFQGTTQDLAQEPHVSGIDRVLVAVEDANDAAQRYGRGFDLPVTEAGLDGERGVQSAFCMPPKGGRIEFVSPAGETQFSNALAESITARREGMYALVLQTAGLEAARQRLEDHGLETTSGPEGVWTRVGGARLLLEAR